MKAVALLEPVAHGAHMVLVGQAVPQVLQGHLPVPQPQVLLALMEVEGAVVEQVGQQVLILAEWAEQAVRLEAEGAVVEHRPQEPEARTVQAQMARYESIVGR